MATKAELEKQRDDIQSKIEALYAELKPINDALDEIETKEETEAIAALGKKHGIVLYVGREFIVTPAIHQYAKEQGFCDGYFRAWLVGQKARITQINTYSEKYPIRAECDTGQSYRQGIGLNDEQRNKMIPFIASDYPIPIESIAEALHAN